MKIYITDNNAEVLGPDNMISMPVCTITGATEMIHKVLERLFAEKYCNETEKLDKLKDFLAYYEKDNLDEIQDMITELHDEIEDLEQEIKDQEDHAGNLENAITNAYDTLRRAYESF